MIKLYNLSGDQLLLGLAILFSISYQFLHLDLPVTSPHEWRQFETLNFIRDYAQGNNSLLYPNVVWMGAEGNLVLEFPLLQYAIGKFMEIFNIQNLIFIRVVFITIFYLTAFYLFKIIKELYDQKTAVFVLFIYLFTPLAIYYASALTIDFFTLFCVLCSMWYYLKYLKAEKIKNLIICLAFLFTATLVKVTIVIPYVLFFAALLYRHFKKRNFSLSKMPKSYLWFLIIPIAFFMWRLHTFNVNSNVVDLSFIPGFIKFIDMSNWYFGSLDQRFDFENWKIIYEYLRYEVLGEIGYNISLFCLVLGFFSIKKGSSKAELLWLLGGVIYLLIFFNLNLIHNYYWIAVLPIFSLLLGVGVNRLGKIAFYTPYFVLVCFCCQNIVFANKHYYHHDPHREEVFSFIENQTQKKDVLIMSGKENNAISPIELGSCSRRGFNLSHKYVDLDKIMRLKALGATKLVLYDIHDFSWVYNQMPYLRSYYSVYSKLGNTSVFIIDLNRFSQFEIDIPQRNYSRRAGELKNDTLLLSEKEEKNVAMFGNYIDLLPGKYKFKLPYHLVSKYEGNYFRLQHFYNGRVEIYQTKYLRNFKTNDFIIFEVPEKEIWRNVELFVYFDGKSNLKLGTVTLEQLCY